MNANLPMALPQHDELARLAHDDPEAYEEFRLRLIENFLDGVPEQRQARLRGLQFQIECVRRLSKSPLGSTVRIYDLMWRSFLLLNDNWQELMHDESAAAPAQPPVREAQILEFRRPAPALTQAEDETPPAAD